MVRKPGRVYLPRRASSDYPQGVKTFEAEGDSVAVRERAVQQSENMTIIHCEGTHAFNFGVDAHEGWMLGIFEVDGLGLVGYRREVPVYPERP